jgi:ABC-type transport system substrate-binding protein
VARALAAAVVVSLLAVSGAGGAPAQQSPRRGGTVVFGPVQQPSCLNPLVSSCAVITSFWVTDKVLTPAFLRAPDSSLRPALVSRVEYTNTRPFTLTYHIRPEARWSDGVPVAARDFVFTQRAIRKHLARDPGYAIHALVESIRVVDAKTVVVVLRSRAAEWRSLFPFVLPRHALVGEDLARVWLDGLDDPKTGEPISSGPWLVEKWEPGRQLTLIRNRRYWGAHPAYLDRLVVGCGDLPCSRPAIWETLRQGQLDFVLSRDPEDVAELRKISTVRTYAVYSNSWEHLDLRVDDGANEALRGPRGKLVRQALAYGINRVALVRQLLGDADPAYKPSQSAAFLNTSRYYVPNWRQYTYRPALARRLLERAGCRAGTDGIYSCGGTRLSLRFFTTFGIRPRVRSLELMQAQLRRIGVEVVPFFAPGGVFFDQILPSGAFDAAAYTWFVGGAIAGKDLFGCGGPGNYSGYCQRLVTKDLDQADRILDADQRARVLNRIDRQLANDVPVIPLYQAPFVLGINKSLRNVVTSPNNPLWNAESWWLER